MQKPSGYILQRQPWTVFFRGSKMIRRQRETVGENPWVFRKAEQFDHESAAF